VLFGRSSREAWNAARRGPGALGTQAQAQQAVTNYHAAVSDFRICLAVFAGAVLVLAALAVLTGRWGHRVAARFQWTVSVLALMVLSVAAVASRPVQAQVAVPTPPRHSVPYCSGGSCPPGLGG
jgi:hypothetical protein